MSENNSSENTRNNHTITEVATHVASQLGFAEDQQALDAMLSMPSVAFDIFSQSHRRYIIRYLLDNGTPATVDELSTYIAARERNTSPAAITAGERKEVSARLIHIHLPKLVAFELVEWVPERGEIFLYSDDQPITQQNEEVKKRARTSESREPEEHRF